MVFFISYLPHSTLIRSTTAEDFVSRNTASPDRIDTAMHTTSISMPEKYDMGSGSSRAVRSMIVIVGSPNNK